MSADELVDRALLRPDGTTCTTVVVDAGPALAALPLLLLLLWAMANLPKPVAPVAWTVMGPPDVRGRCASSARRPGSSRS